LLATHSCPVVWPQGEIVNPHCERSAVPRHAAGEGLSELARQFPLRPRSGRIAGVGAQRRNVNSNIAERSARLSKHTLTSDRNDKRERPERHNRRATKNFVGEHYGTSNRHAGRLTPVAPYLRWCLDEECVRSRHILELFVFRQGGHVGGGADRRDALLERKGQVWGAGTSELKRGD
jgi:hypothetical protein